MPPNNNLQSLFNVNGLVAVITGGGSGLGLYAARALDANGAKAVYIVGRREDILRKAAETGVNGTIIPIVGDVTDKDSLAKIASQVRKEQGFINLLFANAGVAGPRLADYLPKGLQSRPTIKEFQEASWEPSMDFFTSSYHVNATSVFYTTIAFLDLLDEGNRRHNVAQESQVLVTSSVGGFNRVLSSGISYQSSKAATNHLVKMLSTYFAQNEYHIRANIIAPGMYPSEMTSGMTAQLDRFNGIGGHEGAFDGAFIVPHARTPAGRTGSEQDFAATVLFMASQAGAYLNGQTIVTDGGWLTQVPATC